jgi:class 3 adenylate cyclase
MATTRRLAAIVAADVAAYSRLMGKDEVGTARALSEHRAAANPPVARHGGSLRPLALIEFSSVVDAVDRLCFGSMIATVVRRHSDPEQFLSGF